MIIILIVEALKSDTVGEEVGLLIPPIILKVVTSFLELISNDCSIALLNFGVELWSWFLIC